MEEQYEWLSNIDSLNFAGKSALIIGGREMAKQYVLGLTKLGVNNITIISERGEAILDFCKEHDVKLLTGGYEKQIPNVGYVDLTIIAPPIPLTLDAARLAIKCGQDNILIEKPGSLYHKEMEKFASEIKSQKILVGYNRLLYTNFHRLLQLVKEDGGITSCRFTFTEWLNRMDFAKDQADVYQRWGISNSLHVITMAMELIGMPKEIFPHQYGELEWHKSGSIFVGSGISQNNIPFTYHADWGSGGRWGLEVYTRKNSYLLMPLEDLYVSPKYTGKFEPVTFRRAFSDVKQGIAEEIALMLTDDIEKNNILTSLKKAIKFNIMAEQIFGYE